jgi:hypothetical protein
MSLHLDDHAYHFCRLDEKGSPVLTLSTSLSSISCANGDVKVQLDRGNGSLFSMPQLVAHKAGSLLHRTVMSYNTQHGVWLQRSDVKCTHVERQISADRSTTHMPQYGRVLYVNNV